MQFAHKCAVDAACTFTKTQLRGWEDPPNKRGAKILLMAVCGAVLDTPVQMDTWMWGWSGGAVTWMDSQGEKIMQNLRLSETTNCRSSSEGGDELWYDGSAWGFHKSDLRFRNAYESVVWNDSCGFSFPFIVFLLKHGREMIYVALDLRVGSDTVWIVDIGVFF